MKEQVTKFDLSAAFKALDEIEVPKAEEGIKPNRVNLKETFNKKLKTDLLLEDYFDITSSDGLNEAEEERNAEIAQAKLDKIEKIVDLDAKSPEDLQPSYVGKVIVQCPQCMTLFYKDENDLIYDENDKTLVNVGEKCQHCGNESGYNTVGKVEGVTPKAEETPAEEPDMDLALNTEEPTEEPAEETSEGTDDLTLDLDLGEETPEEEKKEESFTNPTGETLTEATDAKAVLADFDAKYDLESKNDVEDETLLEIINKSGAQTAEEAAEAIKKAVDGWTVAPKVAESLNKSKFQKDCEKESELKTENESENLTLNEAAQDTNALSRDLIAKIPALKNITPNCARHIIKVYEKDTETKPRDVKIEDVVEWFDNIDDFVITFAEDLPFADVIALVKNAPKVLKACKNIWDEDEMDKFLKNYENGRAATDDDYIDHCFDADISMKETMKYLVPAYNKLKESLNKSKFQKDCEKKSELKTENESENLTLNEGTNDKDLNAKLKAHNEYINYLQKMIKQEEAALKSAKNEEVKSAIQRRIDAFKEDLDAALPEAVKNDVAAEELPAADELNLELDKVEEPAEEKPAQESLNKAKAAELKNECENKSEKAVSLNEDAGISEAELDKLLNSDEFETPITDDEVEAYLQEPEFQFEALTNEEFAEQVQNIDENLLNNIITKSLQEVYSNVENFTTTECSFVNSKLVVEGVTHFKSGKEKVNKYVFREMKMRPNYRIEFTGLNESITNNGGFKLVCAFDRNSKELIAESLSYSYTINDNLVEGLIEK